MTKCYLFILLLFLSFESLSAAQYDSTLALINRKRTEIRVAHQSGQVDIDSVGRFYTDLLVHQLIPFWYGTAWDFNGYTAKPGEGTVACGYFVSTTLKHSGLVLNRYKMAQKSASEGARYLEPSDSLVKYRCSRDSFVVRFMREAKDGLYMVGLSFHVGYLYKSHGELYFIHSDYTDSRGVVREKASESLAFANSGIYLIADITHNKHLMKRWLNQEELQMQ